MIIPADTSSPLREIIWLEVQGHPGISAKQIEANLGVAHNTGVHSYLTEMFRARMLDRKLNWQESASVAGRNSYYVYTVPENVKEFKWVTPAAKVKAKKIKRAKETPKQLVEAISDKQRRSYAEKQQALQAVPVTPAPTRQAVVREGPINVDVVLANLAHMSVRDVLKLRKGIDEALTA